MTNLWNETLSVLETNRKTISDILWVGSEDGKYFIPLTELQTVLNIDYDSGYGAQEIASDLVIVGIDWWLERHEYDGAELWHFKCIPVLSQKPEQIIRVGTGMWDSIEELRQQGERDRG